MTQRHKVSKCICKNGADDKLVWHRVASGLQFMESAMSVKDNKVKQ